MLSFARLHGLSRPSQAASRAACTISYRPGFEWPDQRRVAAKYRTEGKHVADVDVTDLAAGTAVNGPAAAAAASKVQSAASGEATHTFNWHQQWYPAAVLEDLTPARPTPFTLLGREMVIWRDGGGAWRVMADQCPHRLAPLSEGRLEADGTLQCSYHGWRFDGTGACKEIPQLADGKPKSAAMANPRACATAFPTREAQGLLWVWADADAASAAEAAQCFPAQLLESQLEGGAYEPSMAWFMREFPFSYVHLMENVQDPVHVPFSHHGVQATRSMAAPTVLRPTAPLTKAGFSTTVDNVLELSFTPPCYTGYYMPGAKFSIWAVPTDVGRSRVFTRMYRRRDAPPWHSGSPRRWPGRLWKVLTERVRLLQHALVRNATLDGDAFLLYKQERVLAVLDNNWKRGYYMPGAFDTAVSTWRAWMDRFGKEVPVHMHPKADLPPLVDRRAVFDRYSQHTVHCRTCMQALQRIDAAIPLLSALVAVLLAAVAIQMGRGAPLLAPAVVACALAAAAVAVAVKGLQWFRARLVFVDYVHADRH